MNKTGQVGDLENWIWKIILVFVFISIFIAVLNFFNCPKCDCSSIEDDLSNCQTNNTKLARNISSLKDGINEIKNSLPVNTTYVKVPVYKEKLIPASLNIIAFFISIGITISLFRIKISLPKRIGKKLEKIEKIIIWLKVCSLIVTLLLFLRVLYFLISLF
tara:strand:+ start:5649 stop:6131 length:483 start_codon:yes stop_codon:yes gene_type:complete